MLEMKIAAPAKNDRLDRCAARPGLQETARVSRLSASAERRGRPRNMCEVNFGSFSSCKDAFSLPLSGPYFHLVRSHTQYACCHYVCST